MPLASYITTGGLAVMNKLLATKGPLKFVRAELGDGTVASEEAARARTALVSKVADATLVQAKLQDGQAIISAQYDNASLSTPLVVREVGLYAQDPTGGSAVLYCYCTFSDYPDTIAPASVARYIRTYDITTIVSTLDTVTVTAAPAAMVSQQQFEEALTQAGIALAQLQQYVLQRLGSTDFGAVTATADELNYVHGVTSSIQAQLNGKAASTHTHGNLTNDGKVTEAAAGAAAGTAVKPLFAGSDNKVGVLTLAQAQAALKVPTNRTATASLPVAGWTGDAAPYTQTVSVTGMTADAAAIITATPESYTAWQNAEAYCSAQGAGTLTFSCRVRPAAALTANVLIVGVNG